MAETAPTRATARKASSSRKAGGTVPPSDKNGGKVVVDDEARALAALMLEQVADPDRIARELGGSITQAAASLLASATAKGPAAIPSLAILGRIIGATWAEKRTEAGNKAAGNAALVAALQSALSQPREAVRVVSSMPGGLKSATPTRAETVDALGF
jgi:hypothetical protein